MTNQQGQGQGQGIGIGPSMPVGRVQAIGEVTLPKSMPHAFVIVCQCGSLGCDKTMAILYDPEKGEGRVEVESSKGSSWFHRMPRSSLIELNQWVASILGVDKDRVEQGSVE